MAFALYVYYLHIKRHSWFVEIAVHYGAEK